jgi:hypothetical protein
MSETTEKTVSEVASTISRFSDPQAQAAADVCRDIRKSLTTFRMYEPDHNARTEAGIELFKTVTNANETMGEISLQISANSILWADNAIYSEEGSQSDSLTRNLFMDGVQKINFLPGVLQSELDGFLVLWHIAIHGQFPPGHSFSTRVWESDYSFISLQVVESFADVLESTGAEGRSTREKNIEDLSTLILQKEAPRAPPDGMIRASNLPIAADVNVIAMQLENIGGIDPAKLPPHDLRSMKGIHPLTNEEMSLMVSQIRSSLQDSAGQRALAILWAMLPIVSSKQDTTSLERLVQRVFRMLIGEGAYDELDDGIKNIITMVRAVPARFPELEHFLAHLMTEEGLNHLVSMLSHPERQQFGIDILRYLPGNQLWKLVAQLSSAKDKNTRGLLVGLIQKKGVSVDVLVEELKRIGPQTTDLDYLDELYSLTETLQDEESDQFINAGLAHIDRRVRTYTFNNLTQESLARYSERFYRLLADPSSEIWRLVLNNLVRLRDQGAVPHLIPILNADKASLENRKTVIRSLGAIGGARAAAALEKVFMGKDSMEIRCAAALSLGNVGDPLKWKEIFQKEVKKLLGNKELKAACTEALRRIELKLEKTGG